MPPCPSATRDELGVQRQVHPISANIAPGLDGKFGTADDVRISPTRQGAITMLTVKGTLSGSTNPAESFGVVAHGTTGFASAAGLQLRAPATLGNLVIRQNL